MFLRFFSLTHFSQCIDGFGDSKPVALQIAIMVYLSVSSQFMSPCLEPTQSALLHHIMGVPDISVLVVV